MQVPQNRQENIHSSFVHYTWKKETIQMPINRRVSKQPTVDLYMKYHRDKKEKFRKKKYYCHRQHTDIILSKEARYYEVHTIWLHLFKVLKQKWKEQAWSLQQKSEYWLKFGCLLLETRHDWDFWILHYVNIYGAIHLIFTHISVRTQ